MSPYVIFYVIYAVALLAGGAIGYAKAKSAQSLAAGVVSALLMLFAAWRLSEGHTKQGFVIGAVVSLALGVFFLLRFVRTRKAMPAIPMTVLSDLVFLLSLFKLVTK